MVIQPDNADMRITGVPDGRTSIAPQKARRFTFAHFMLNVKNKNRNKPGNETTITLDEAARLLNISSATAKLWSDMGLLRTIISPGNMKTVKLTDITTFLSKDKRPISVEARMSSNPIKLGSKGQDRKKLARINIRAISRLTKKSVFEIDHLGGTPRARTRK